MTSEAIRLLPDTHALLWHIADSPRLSNRARRLMDSADQGTAELVVPTIVLAEAVVICERRNPGTSIDEVFRRISDMPNAVIASLDMNILTEALLLSSSLEMHDRLIAATARVFGATFISRDRQLATLVDTVW